MKTSQEFTLIGWILLSTHINSILVAGIGSVLFFILAYIFERKGK